ncbi:MAG TPA: ADP-glyceromanno-heptose 6-epimerase [Candidatus Omnitrophota bacterium]|nr:ADP-glyceromanno-heptose 6-epimerase [Candidatus Omnitrophota bacterium]
MIVLTGAAGFIGSCLLEALNACGRTDILIVDHLDSDLKPKNLHGKKFIEYLDKKDFLGLVTSRQLSSSVDCIIHMGACSSTILQDEQYYEENNFLYTRILAQWALERRVQFIYASSAATYGDGSRGYSDDHDLIKKCQPLNLYGASKQKFDMWALNEGVLDQMVGLKFFNVFGPNEYHKGPMRSVILKAYKKVIEESKMLLFKSYKKEYAHGEQKRDFIYVKDAVDVVMFFLAHPELSGIYNVGTGKARTWNDVAHALFAAVGKQPSIEYIEMPAEIRGQYQYFTEARMEKLRSVGYARPFTTLENSVADYVYYLERKAYI